MYTLLTYLYVIVFSAQRVYQTVSGAVVDVPASARSALRDSIATH